ncbi:ribosome recycling factor [Albimonas pacifica]|uniref:Ribosome-recycling factor n=1 Tax=Albimonas pacifica TaxID=1114924 RepID=A0A1I3L5X7_9RHOB|nr:ribosome recycling factor [Albimonas pacifica]SFI80164.1 ribosome recycling factor [Albimonas pacifica]
MSDEIEIDVDDLERRMDGALASLKHDYASLRTGRATASMLDPVTVDAYGVDTPLNQVATINVPEPRMITLAIWDKAMVGKVDKAIRSSGLGLNPVVDGTLVRLPIPELNEERRRELAKLAGQYAEAAKVAVRNVRRDGMDMVKKAQKDGLSEDDAKLYSDEIQSLTDAAIKKIDAAQEHKQEEIMQV